MDSNNLSNVAAAVQAGRELALVQRVLPDGTSAPVMLVPQAHRVEVLNFDAVEKWLPRPVRKRGTFAFGAVDSFVRYFNEHKSEDSRIFAAVTDAGASFKGVLDFHGKEASFNEHVAVHVLAATHEWAAFMGNNKKSMSQAEFAQFLEENADWFTVPTGAALLELIQTLEGKSNVSFNQAVKLQNGALRLNYSEEVELKGASGTGSEAGSMTIPSVLEVGIAPFQGVARYAMRARLRYRIESRKISFWYEAVDAHLVVRTVCAEVLKVMEEKTKVQPFLV